MEMSEIQADVEGSDEAIQPHPSDKSSNSFKCSCKIRYGHWYGGNDHPEHPVIKATRESEWKRILESSRKGKESPEDIEQIYFDEIKKKCQGVLRERDQSFVKKLIQDGCLFLLSALSILGYDIGNPNNKKDGDQDREQIREMFCAHCNEMHLVVLNTLIHQKFFQDIVLQKRPTKTPSTFVEKALHELLVLPALKRKEHPRWCTCVTTCFSKMCEITNTYVLTPCCCIVCSLPERFKTTEARTEFAPHILHGLQNLLIFGPKKHLACIEHEIYIDLETNSKKDGRVSVIDHRCVSPLRQSGICIKTVKNGGIRSIDLQSRLFCACLYLPAFELDGNTEMILQHLIHYEKRYFRYHYQREVSSYIKFMSRIVQTRKDAKLLADKNIVVGDSKLVPKLPAILRKLASSLDDDIVLTPQLQTVEDLIREYRPLNVFRKLFSIMLILSLIQVVFSFLRFFNVELQVR